MLDLRNADWTRTDWLKFVPMMEALEEAVPSDVAQIGISSFGASPQGENFDSDMLLLKGIMCGALCSVSATEVMHIVTDDMPGEFFDWDEEAYLAKLAEDEFWETSYAGLLARVYYGHCDRREGGQRFEFKRSADGYEYYFSGSVQIYRNVFQTSESGDVEQGGENFWVDVIYLQMEADGGPPGDLFLVKSTRED